MPATIWKTLDMIADRCCNACASRSFTQFRADYAYTNFGVTAAAEAVAAASHTDWASLSEHVLYKPLGMMATSSRFADFVHRPNHAVGYVRVGDELCRRSTNVSPMRNQPAGGVSSSAHDMARWMTMVLHDGVFEGKTIVAADALLTSTDRRDDLVTFGRSRRAAPASTAMDSALALCRPAAWR